MINHRIKLLRAFTVVEILLVVLILAISAMMVVPMVGGRESVVIAGATRKIVADLQYAQSYAIATRQSIYIRFQADQYQLCMLSGGALSMMTHPVDKDPFVVQFGPGGETNLQRVSLPAASIAGRTVLGFDSLGAPFAFDEGTQTRSNLNAVATIQINSGSTTQFINIEPYTGEVTVP